jgi:putative endonuclease
MYYIYITANKYNSVLYIGFTSDLGKRIYEHKEKIADGFTKKYNVDKLVYYEAIEDRDSALAREKEIKGWRREKKLYLISTMNSSFADLFNSIDW